MAVEEKVELVTKPPLPPLPMLVRTQQIHEEVVMHEFAFERYDVSTDYRVSRAERGAQGWKRGGSAG